MKKIRIKKENVSHFEDTDVMKIVLKSLNRNGKNNILLCDPKFGFEEDEVYYYVILAQKGKGE